MNRLNQTEPAVSQLRRVTLFPEENLFRLKLHFPVAINGRPKIITSDSLLIGNIKDTS